MRKYCADCYWSMPTELNKFQRNCVKHAALVSEDFCCDYHLNKNHMIWMKARGNYLTLSEDPMWECPICHDKHIFGIHTLEYSKYCSKCGNRMYYPWEEEDEGK